MYVISPGISEVQGYPSYLNALVRLLHGRFGVLEEPHTEVLAAGGQDLVVWVEVYTGHLLQTTTHQH